MRIHVLVEGPSETALLRPWLKRFQPGHSHHIVEHQGKGSLPKDPAAPPNPVRRGLLDQLPAKLRAYGATLDPRTDRVLVLVDADDDDCVALKRSMAELLAVHDSRPMAMFRIAVEEVEAFYLGDVEAIRGAFGRVRRTQYNSYQQDSIVGTWEAFQAVIAAKYVDKVGWAQRMGQTLGTEFSGPRCNRSPSFVQFCRALQLLAGDPLP